MDFILDTLSQDLCCLWSSLSELNCMEFGLVVSVVLSPTWLSNRNGIEISHREWALQSCACFIISDSANKGAVCFYFTEWILLDLLWVYMAKASDKQSQ